MRKFIVLTNLSQPSSRPVVAQYCKSFFCRFRGLMFTRRILPDQGLLLVQDQENRLDASIHMLFMAFDLTLVWINKDLEVVDICLARRWRPAYVPRKAACYVLEAHPDRLLDFNIGDKVSLHETVPD